jgi:hypothetical protein
MVDGSADSPHSMATDQVNIVLESHRNKKIPQQRSVDISAHTSKSETQFDTKGSKEIMPHHLTCTTSKTMSYPDLPDQHYPLTISPVASGSALDFLWAAACANPVGGIVPDQASSECVDRANPLDVDWGAWPPTGRRAGFSVSAGGAI